MIGCPKGSAYGLPCAFRNPQVSQIFLSRKGHSVGSSAWLNAALRAAL